MTNTDSKEQNEKKSHNSTLGRRLSRRLSLVTKVPSIINAKLKHDVFSSSTPDFFVMDKKSFDLIAIAPDKTQRIVPCSVGQTIMEAITPILQEFSIDQPKLYLGGSQAIVEPEADCAFLYDNVLIIDRGEPTDEFDGANMNFFKLHEKIMNEESEYVKILLSAAELYDNPVPSTTNSICDLSIIFQSLNNLAAVCSEVVNEHGVVSNSYLGFAPKHIVRFLSQLKRAHKRKLPTLASTLLLGNNSFFDVCCVFNDKLWEEYDNYLLNYRTFKRLIRQKKNEDENFVHICRLRQGAAKYSLEQIIDFPVSFTLKNISKVISYFIYHMLLLEEKYYSEISGAFCLYFFFPFLRGIFF